jgi:hypothetical protein
MNGILNTTTISGSCLSEDYVGLKWRVNSRHPGWLGVWTCSSIAANLFENAALHESVDGTEGGHDAMSELCPLL